MLGDRRRARAWSTPTGSSPWRPTSAGPTCRWPTCCNEALEDPPFDVRVENEANLGAVAELVEGAGRGLRDFVYVSGEIGIGAGVVLRGELFRGASGFAGEFGHLTIDPFGPPCGCGGRGCLERLAGQDALLRLAGWDARMRCAGSRPGVARRDARRERPRGPRAARSRRSARWATRSASRSPR